MFKLNRLSGIPIYEQIVEQLKRMILSDIVKPEEMLPSVRALSVELSVNPNTLQKAYNELEQKGITTSVPGIGRFVSKEAKQIVEKERIRDGMGLYEAAFNLAMAGATLESLRETVEKGYEAAKKHSKERGENHHD